MIQSPDYIRMSKTDLIAIIENQKLALNYERQKRQWYENILANKDLPINLRLATIAAEKLAETSKPSEDGYYRVHLPALAETVGVSASTMSRGLRNLADCTEAIEHTTQPKKDEPHKDIVFIRPTALLERPQDIKPIKEIKKHGGDHRIARCNGCGSENIIEKKYQVCGDCGQVYKTFEDREVNQPLQDATGVDEQEESEIISLLPTGESDEPLQDATLSVDTLVSIARCNGSILEELKSLPIWCCHRKKEPFDVSRNCIRCPRAESDNPKTWATYERAKAVYEQSHTEGWKEPFDGLMFANNGDYVFIDGDHCISETGQINALGREILALNSYAEQSYRGGVKVTVTSRKVASEESRVPTSALESELDLFWLFFPRRLVLTSGSGYTQREQRVPVPMILGTSSRIL